MNQAMEVLGDERVLPLAAKRTHMTDQFQMPYRCADFTLVLLGELRVTVAYSYDSDLKKVVGSIGNT